MSVEPSGSREPAPSQKSNLGKAALLGLAYMTESFVVSSLTYLAISQFAHVDNNTAFLGSILTGVGTSYGTALFVSRRSSR